MKHTKKIINKRMSKMLKATFDPVKTLDTRHSVRSKIGQFEYIRNTWRDFNKKREK